MKINNTELVHWFNAIRNLPDHEQRSRMLDSLWDGQLDSKVWLVDELPSYVMGPQNIYIFGGWTGILANLLFNSEIQVNKIRSIDLDPWCEKVADDVNKIHEMNGWRFKARTADMMVYDYEWGIAPSIVINTSTEHVDQNTYDAWYSKIPKGTLVAIQGNDFFDCPEHVRCCKSLNDFEAMNLVTDSLYRGELKTSMYTRYMSIWRKQ